MMTYWWIKVAKSVKWDRISHISAANPSYRNARFEKEIAIEEIDKNGKNRNYPDNIMMSKRRLKDILKFLQRLFRRLKIIKKTSYKHPIFYFSLFLRRLKDRRLLNVLFFYSSDLNNATQGQIPKWYPLMFPFDPNNFCLKYFFWKCFAKKIFWCNF